MVLKGQHEGVWAIVPLMVFFLIIIWVQILLIETEIVLLNIIYSTLYTVIFMMAILLLVGVKAYREEKITRYETGIGVATASLPFAFVGYSSVLVGIPLIFITPIIPLAIFTYGVVMCFAFVEELFTYGLVKLFVSQTSGRIQYYPATILGRLFFAGFHYGAEGFNALRFVGLFTLGILFSVMLYETHSFMGTGLAHTSYNYVYMGWGITLPMFMILLFTAIYELRG